MSRAVTHYNENATANTCLAAALSAVGIPLAEKPFIRVTEDGRRERTVWFFEPQSACGKHSTKKLIEAWSDDGWHTANPEHPFAYIKCAMRNRELLVDKVKQNVPLVCVKRHGKIAYLPMNATEKMQDQFMRHL